MQLIQRNAAVLGALCLLIVGCAPGGGTSGPGGPGTGRTDVDGGGGSTPIDGGRPPVTPPPESCPGGGATTLSGTVTFPNGTLPVAGAFVYIPAGSPDAVSHSGMCGECVDSAGLITYATAGVDGRFTLVGVPEGAITLVVEKGKFRRTVPVTVTRCVDNPVPAASTRLPASTSEGELPRIAVVTGDFDHMEDVLVRLGLSATAFDVFSGGLETGDEGAASAAFLRDGARVAGYDIVFVDCGAAVGEPSYSPLLDAAIVNNLKTFVERGGRLYVTDLAYDLVEAPYPNVIDFQGAAGDGLGMSAEEGDAAEVGSEMATVMATVHDDALREWLITTGAIPASGAMPIQGLLGGWAVIDHVDATRAKVWTSGDVEWSEDPYDPYGRTQHAVRPLTVTFEAGCGRALFTSYHTVFEGGGAASLSAQEQALAYLVLEIGACIEDPTLI